MRKKPLFTLIFMMVVALLLVACGGSELTSVTLVDSSWSTSQSNIGRTEFNLEEGLGFTAEAVNFDTKSQWVTSGKADFIGLIKSQNSLEKVGWLGSISGIGLYLPATTLETNLESIIWDGTLNLSPTSSATNDSFLHDSKIIQDSPDLNARFNRESAAVSTTTRSVEAVHSPYACGNR